MGPDDEFEVAIAMVAAFFTGIVIAVISQLVSR